MTTPLPQINALVTNELIELHAKAICNATGGPQWDELQSTRQAGIMRAEARAALAKVAPLIAAKALRDAADELAQQGVEPWDRNSVAIRTLHFRADQLNPYERKDRP